MKNKIPSLFSRSESEIETAREREVKMKFFYENSRETRISLVSTTQLPCACSPNCFGHAPFTRAIAMRTPLLCTCASHYFAHAHPIALHMRKPLLCTCAPHCFAHARPIIPRTSTIRKHAAWSSQPECSASCTA